LFDILYLERRGWRYVRAFLVLELWSIDHGVLGVVVHAANAMNVNFIACKLKWRVASDREVELRRSSLTVPKELEPVLDFIIRTPGEVAPAPWGLWGCHDLSIRRRAVDNRSGRKTEAHFIISSLKCR
jgi:hypothetical protein